MPRLLLIDDDEAFRTPLRIALEQVGHTVTEARDGKEGLALYQAASHALVLCDLIMPEQDGLEVIIELRRRNPAVKIIAISAGTRYSPDSELAAAIAMGASRAFGKPFQTARLLAAINDLLGLPATGKKPTA